MIINFTNCFSEGPNSNNDDKLWDIFYIIYKLLLRSSFSRFIMKNVRNKEEVSALQYFLYGK